MKWNMLFRFYNVILSAVFEVFSEFGERNQLFLKYKIVKRNVFISQRLFRFYNWANCDISALPDIESYSVETEVFSSVTGPFRLTH